MDWRREDSGYAAAAFGAVGLLVYLLAANFGLVPSPIRGLGGTPGVETAIDIAPAAAIADADDLPGIAPTPQPVIRPPATPAAPSRDATPPALSFSTADGATFGVSEPAVVTGRASDLAAGIDQVFVRFTTGSQNTTRPAKVTCKDASRRDCTWSADVPAVLANYTVTAQAVDRAGNHGKREQIQVTVVNSGGVVRQVGETVRRVPNLLERVVDGLLGGLLGR